MRALSRTVDAVLILVVVLGLSAAVLIQLVPLTGRMLVVISGGSMSPAIPIGSLVIAERVAAGDPLAVGDVVTIRLDEGRALVTHRIVRLVDRAGAPWLELRGDANAEPDPVLVPASAVMGRVAATLPEAGRWLRAFTSGPGFLALAGLAGSLYAISLLLRPRAPSSSESRPARVGAAPAGSEAAAR